MSIPNLLLRNEGSGSSTSAVWVLSGPKNFGAWKQLMQAQLEFRELWEVVREEQKVLDEKKDREALLILKQSVSPPELEKTGVCLTSHELWRKLQENYIGSRQSLVTTVSAEWATMARKNGEDLITFCGRFEVLLAKMKAIEYNVPEDQKFHFFIKSLSGLLREFAYTWKLCTPNGRISELISAVKSRHHTEELMTVDAVSMYLAPGSTAKQNGNSNSKAANGKQNYANKGGNSNANASASNSNANIAKPKPVNNNRQQGKSGLICRCCNQPGHKWRDCPTLKSKYDRAGESSVQQTWANQPQATNNRGDIRNEAGESLFMVKEHPFRSGESHEWVADSGSTRHITPDKLELEDYITYDKPIVIHTGGSPRLAVGEGSYKFKTCNRSRKLTNVLHVPDFPVRVISLMQVTRLGHTVIIDTNGVEIHSQDGTHMKGYQKDGLPIISLEPYYLSHGEKFYGASLEEWHLRLAHLSKDQVARMMRQGLVKRLELNTSRTTPCLDCLVGKACRVPHPTRDIKIIDANYVRLHVDTCGPMTTESSNGNKYLVVAVEESSNFRFVLPIKVKSEAAGVVKMIINQIHATGKTVIELHSDNGGEYLSMDLRTWLAERGIAHTFSTPYTPQQNGVAERAIRSIVGAARTQLIKSGLPMKLWDQASTTTCYSLNRCPSPRNDNKTRFELYYGYKPDVSNLRVFGQKAVCRYSDPLIAKWNPRGRIAYFVGYTERMNTYTFYDHETNTMFNSCDATFLPLHYKLGEVEKSTASDSQVQWAKIDESRKSPSLGIVRQKGGSPDLINLSTPMTAVNSSAETRRVENLASTPTGTEYQDAHSISDIYGTDEELTVGNLVEDEHDDCPMMIVDNENHNSGHYQGTQTVNDAIHAEILARNQQTPRVTRSATRAGLIPVFEHRKLVSESRGGRPPETEVVEKNLLAYDDEPTLSQAKKRDDWPMWQQAMRSELDSLEENKTWQFVKQPDGCRPISSKWVLKLKRNPDGTISKYKARLVARGFLQKEGIDFSATYSPVASLVVVRLLISIAVQLSYSLFQVDIKCAFLHGNLEEDIYLRAPDGVDCEQGKVLKLNRSLYGLRQAPLEWNKKIDTILKGVGLKQSLIEDCLYYSPDKSFILALYVDDMLIACEDSVIFNQFVGHLASLMELTHSPAKCFLGMQIDIKNDSVFIHQAHYVEELLKEYKLSGLNPVTTPIEMNQKLDGEPLSPSFPFKELLGSLLYLAGATRPDIAYVVNWVSRTVSPNTAHAAVIKRILRYLKGTQHMGIEFRRNGDLSQLQGFSDADWANDTDTRRSITGSLIKWLGPVYWRSVRQKMVTLSSTEAEFVAGCDVAKALIPIRSLLIELDCLPSTQPAQVYIDNTSAICMSSSRTSRQRTKHIDVRSRWLSEQVEKGTIEVHHIPGTEQQADILTKALPGPRFCKIRSLVMVMTFMTIISLSDAASSYNFMEVEPVYYRPTNMAYVIGQTEHTTVVVLATPCRTYFENLLPSVTLNEQLMITCEGWYRRASDEAKPHCSVPRNIDSSKKVTNKIGRSLSSNEIELQREKRFVGGAVAIVVLGPAVTYSIVQGEKNARNLKILAESTNNLTMVTEKALATFNTTRHVISEMNDMQMAMKLELFYLNNTIEGFGKAMALAFDAYTYFEDFKDNYRIINQALKQNRMSGRLQEMSKEKLWTPGAEEFSFFSKCYYSTDNKGIFQVEYEYTMPEIDLSAKIVEADAFKVWSHESKNRTCRLKYVGPRYILVNSTNGCMADIDSSWLSGLTLEGHPCVETEQNSTRVVVLTTLQQAYHKDFCVKDFKPMSSDIQIKRHNGFHHIYCYGFKIKIGLHWHLCPIRPFELPFTQPWILNGHENHAREKHTVVVNAEEMHLNREIAKAFNLKPDIKGINLTMLDQSVGALNSAFQSLGLNVTVDSLGIGDFIPSFDLISNVFSKLKEYATYGLIALAAITSLILLAMVSPLLNIMIVLVRAGARLLRWPFSQRQRTRERLHDHFV